MIQIKFFASLRERIGTSSLNLEYAGENTVADVGVSEGVPGARHLQ